MHEQMSYAQLIDYERCSEITSVGHHHTVVWSFIIEYVDNGINHKFNVEDFCKFTNSHHYQVCESVFSINQNILNLVLDQSLKI